jgi:colicin import membrane protein
VEPPPLATPAETPDPADAAPRPIMKTASLAEKRAQFKKQQEQAKQQAAEDARKAADAKKAEEEKKKAEDARKAAEKKQADEKKRIEQAKADEAKKVADEVANLINMEDSRGATTGDGGQKTLGRQDGRSATLSQSEIGALVAQIRSCIAMPAGAEDADARAELYFNVAADGSLVGRPEITSAGADTIGQAYARAVARAVMQCGPYAVVAGQEVKALFQAREF